MPYGDTVEIVHDGVTLTLTRIGSDNDAESEFMFRDSAAEYRMKIRHSYTGSKTVLDRRERHNVELTRLEYAVGDEPAFTEKTYLVYETLGSEVNVDLSNALANWLVANTNANLDKLIQWEN
jgi:hypothetical protein